MAKFYYRGMAEENGKPKVGRSARLLGVRPGIDIDIEQMPRDYLDRHGYLRPKAERNSTGNLVDVAIRNTKGMSTSASISGLPAFRRPATFGGASRDPLWQIEDSKITRDLETVQDGTAHISVMPRTTMLLEKYEAALANTQDDWKRVG
jgi:hypothetical protein